MKLFCLSTLVMFFYLEPTLAGTIFIAPHSRHVEHFRIGKGLVLTQDFTVIIESEGGNVKIVDGPFEPELKLEASNDTHREAALVIERPAIDQIKIRVLRTEGVRQSAVDLKLHLGLNLLGHVKVQTAEGDVTYYQLSESSAPVRNRRVDLRTEKGHVDCLQVQAEGGLILKTGEGTISAVDTESRL